MQNLAFKFMQKVQGTTTLAKAQKIVMRLSRVVRQSWGNPLKNGTSMFTNLWSKPETKDERVKEYVPEVIEESLIEQRAVLNESTSSRPYCRVWLPPPARGGKQIPNALHCAAHAHFTVGVGAPRI